ncbi:hypothetical protein NN6n1_18570 [Shinella zoogloeoides]
MNAVPRYGVKITMPAHDIYDVLAEEVRLLGYAALDAGFSDDELDTFSRYFEDARARYAEDASRRGYDLAFLKEVDAIRLLPVIQNHFWNIVFNEHLHQLLSRLLGDYYILNQVNGLINRGNNSAYHQAQYHRDLPYQHFTSSRPLAINALFALDDFTLENGATRVIPASHHREAFPPDELVRKAEEQVVVKRGMFIILDCMVYHAGGTNRTSVDRRAINHVFTLPIIRQQFHMPTVVGDPTGFSDKQKKILGYGLEELRSLDDWFAQRSERAG